VLPLLEELGRRGVTNLLVEGGGRVLGSFLDAGQVDAVDVYIAPSLAGGGDDFTPARGLGCRRMADALRLDRHEVSLIDGDLRIQGTLTPSVHGHE
jgi:diaminohydroxyphosphoribosylaminopyrimidine deaminase/5-amino-6-(5-phosphoribosylamino)uracil reductase